MATKPYFTKTPAATAAQNAAPQPQPRAPRKPRAQSVEDAKIIHEGDPINPAPGSAARASMDAKEQSAFERMQQAADEYLATEGVTQWKREAINLVAGLLGYGSTLYFAVQAINVMVTATIMYSGVGFLSFMVMFLGMVAAFFAAWSAGMFVYRVAASFDVQRVKSRITSFFDRSDKETQHA